MEIFNSLYMNTKNINTPLEDIQKQNIVQLIPKLDQKGHDLLFFLIRMYHNQQAKEITFSVPYQTGTNDKNDIEFDLCNFPNHLQHIIHMFVRMHYEYISYETSRSEH
jgi:hypothetical protein